jgi:hypothetical protein
MKQLLFIFIVSLSFSSYGQLTKGNVFFGGSISVSTTNGASTSSNGTTNTELRQFGFAPTVGFLLSENGPWERNYCTLTLITNLITVAPAIRTKAFQLPTVWEFSLNVTFK